MSLLDEDPASRAPSRASSSRRSRSAAAAALVALFGFYAASIPGIRLANEGSHYALVRSLADGNVSIDRHVAYARKIDLASRGGHDYANKAPGTAALSLPMYLAGRAIAGDDAERRAVAPPHTQRRSESNLRVPPAEEYAASLLAPVAGVLLVASSFAFARGLGAATAPAWGIAFAIGLGTMVWRYSSQLFAHVPAAAALMVSMLLAVKMMDGGSRRLAAGLGFALGCAVAIDYPTALPAAAITIVVLASRGRRAPADAAALLAGAAVPVVLLALYHWRAFGSPFSPSYRFDRHLYARSFGTAYSEPVTNIARLLFDGGRGLVPWNPLLLAVPFGVASLWRTRRRNAVLVVAATVPLLILQSTYREWFGGGTEDSRFLITIIPILIAPLALTITRASARRNVAAAGVAVLASAGCALQGFRLLISDWHRPRFAGLAPFVHGNVVDAGRWLKAATAAAFPSLRYLPFTLAAAAVLAAGGLAAWELRRRPSTT